MMSRKTPDQARPGDESTPGRWRPVPRAASSTTEPAEGGPESGHGCLADSGGRDHAVAEFRPWHWPAKARQNPPVRNPDEPENSAAGNARSAPAHRPAAAIPTSPGGSWAWDERCGRTTATARNR